MTAVYAEPHPSGFRLIVAIAGRESLRQAGPRPVDTEGERAGHLRLLPDARDSDAFRSAPLRQALLVGRRTSDRLCASPADYGDQ